MNEHKVKLEVGKRYRLEKWEFDHWLEVLFIGNKYLFGRDNYGKEGSWELDIPWLLYPEKIVKRMAPALVKIESLSDINEDTECLDKVGLFESEEEARKFFDSENYFRGKFLRWPSHPDDLKDYEFPGEA